MKKAFAVLFVSLWTVTILAGCDIIPGMGGEPDPVAQPAPPPAAPVPGQPVAVPTQPVAQPVPGQAVPVPGQPVAQPVPTQPVAVPTQPGAQPGVPPATPIPGQPMAQPVAAQPVVQPMAPVTPPTPTGDALTDKLNTKKFQTAAAFTPTSALVKQKLKKGKPQDYQVQLPGPPYCHTYVAVTGDAVANLDLSIKSPAGAVEAQDATQESAATILNHCPAAPGMYTLSVTIPKNTGEIALQAFSK